MSIALNIALIPAKLISRITNCSVIKSVLSEGSSSTTALFSTPAASAGAPCTTKCSPRRITFPFPSPLCMLSLRLPSPCLRWFQIRICIHKNKRGNIDVIFQFLKCFCQKRRPTFAVKLAFDFFQGFGSRGY